MFLLISIAAINGCHCRLIYCRFRRHYLFRFSIYAFYARCARAQEAPAPVRMFSCRGAMRRGRLRGAAMARAMLRRRAAAACTTRAARYGEKSALPRAAMLAPRFMRAHAFSLFFDDIFHAAVARAAAALCRYHHYRH